MACLVWLQHWSSTHNTSTELWKGKLMLNHVLIPLDGSILASTAISIALKTVDQKCKVTLLTSIIPPEVPVYGEMMVMSPNIEEFTTLDWMRRSAEAYLEATADTLTRQGFIIHTRVEIGEPAQAIIRVANEIEVDMIIMSTHGRTGINRWLFGSVTSKVLSAASCPILVIPAQHDVVKQDFEMNTTELFQG